MQDSYGDGWNGGHLTVYLNGSLFADYSAPGWAGTQKFTVCQTDSIKLFYTPQDYENENTYQLYDENWNLVFADGPDPKTGLVYADTGKCSDVQYTGHHPCTAIPIDTGECLVADNTLLTQSALHPYCADYKGNEVWFILQTPPSGNISIGTEGGDLTDTGLAAWTSYGECSSLRRLACDDDAGPDAYSFITLLNLEPGIPIYIQVFGYGGAMGQCMVCVKDLGVVKLDSSELPIVTIRTNGQEIPNEPKIDALMEIRYNGPDALTYISDDPNVYNGHIGIEVRGASSAWYPQTPYSIETRTADGGDQDVSLLGMPEESDWILLSNYNDRSLMRNMLAQHLFASMGQYAPRQVLVEVIRDSVYQGIYVFSEKIKRDKNRVDIAKLDPDDNAGNALTGGYILQQNLWEPSSSFQSNYSPIDHPGLDVHFIYEYPKPEDITQQQKDYIAAFVDTLETALYSDNFTDPVNGYRKYLDTKSFIDYFLVNEVSRNNDGFKKSVFFHKERQSDGGKFKAGPVWDFDWAWKNMWGCYVFEALDGSGWAHHINSCPTDNHSCGYYIRMLQDTTFAEELKCTYEGYRQTVLDTGFIFAYMDSVAAKVEHAQERHFRKWPILGISGPAPEVNAIATTYAAEMDTLKAWIAQRLDWLDANMPGLCELSTSTHQVETDLYAISFAPNPSHGEITFSGTWNSSMKGYLEIYNALGQPEYQSPLESGSWQKQILLEGGGIYFYILRDHSGIKETGKVIVE